MKQNAISIKHLSVKFDSYTALEDINVQIAEGTLNAIVGPNGSGKTTLLKVLLGLVNYNRGEVRIYDKNIKDIPPDWIGYVPQIKTFDKKFPALPIELVASGIRNSWIGRLSSGDKKKALRALELVGSANLDKQPLNTLSGGELQKIYLARSIVRKPKLLLLDEPATGIDMVCEANLNEIIQDFNKNSKTTIIMVTHNWATANHHAEYVLLLNRRQICYGSPAEAFKEENLSKAFIHIGHHDMEYEKAIHV